MKSALYDCCRCCFVVIAVVVVAAVVVAASVFAVANEVSLV